MVDLAQISGQKAAAAAKAGKNDEVANGLNHDAFMRLFLEQLKNQDPTAPMETDKIITQTAQLTQVEMQEENKKTMKEVAEAMKASKEANEALKTFQNDLKGTLESISQSLNQNTQSNASLSHLSSLGALKIIGKVAETNIDGVNFDGNKLDFSLYFDSPIDATKGNPTIEIFNSDKQLIKTISLKDKDKQAGYLHFQWDGLNDSGKKADVGSYFIKAQYNLDSETRQYEESRIGRGLVESVLFDNGKPMLKMGDLMAPLDSAMEFYDKGTTFALNDAKR
ncbi:MAG: flagellar hook assembly protein FlgD [Helicobacter sp.]|nr:flagellar hook assembly protein FlgD [Helicobacter sp.]